MKSLFLVLFLAVVGFADHKPDAKVDFLTPKNGEKVKNPVKIKMDVSGIKIRPAGEDANDKHSGHHHVLIDMEAMPEGQAIPADDMHLHFGKGQTETEVTLKPGEHKLTLQFADGAHRSYGPKMSKTIKITVTQ
jgi:hypothetical protein